MRRRSAWSDGKSVGGISVAMRVNDAAVSSALAPASCNRFHLGFPNRAHSRFPSTCAVPAQSEGFWACLNIIPSVMVLTFVSQAARHGACCCAQRKQRNPPTAKAIIFTPDLHIFAALRTWLELSPASSRLVSCRDASGTMARPWTGSAQIALLSRHQQLAVAWRSQGLPSLGVPP